MNDLKGYNREREREREGVLFTNMMRDFPSLEVPIIHMYKQ